MCDNCERLEIALAETERLWRQEKAKEKVVIIERSAAQEQAGVSLAGLFRAVHTWGRAWREKRR